MAGRSAAEEAIAIRYMLRSLGVTVNKPTDLLGNNEGMIKSSSLPSSTLKKKHVAISYHKVRECNVAGIIRLMHVPTDKNLSDMNTKALGPSKLNHLNGQIYTTE